jgi:hypothetical protein
VWVISEELLSFRKKLFMESPLRYFSCLTDPRLERTCEHNLEDILFIAITSIICGADGWNEMEEFGKTKEDWLKTFLRLPGGIPSHDTFNRVFSAKLITCWLSKAIKATCWNK